MDPIPNLAAKCRENPKRIVLPETDDGRILEAASKVLARKTSIPVLIGPEDGVMETAAGMDIDLSSAEIIDPSHHPSLPGYVGEYVSMRAFRNVPAEIARRVLSKNLHFGAMMLRMGHADGLVAGASNLTASVIKAGKLLVGLEAGTSEPSSFFIMHVPGHGPMVFADCAVNPNPTSDLLAHIATITARSAANLLSVEPRVALLSFSTKGSANHPDVRKVSEATRIARELAPDLRIDGELQADAAVVPAVARKKGAGEILGGRANVLIFPDLDSANIAYKLVQHLAGARAYGPFMQGFRKPVNDLSRGCTLEEIVGTIMVTSVQADDRG